MKTKTTKKAPTAVAVKEKVSTAIVAIASVDPQALLMQAIDKNLPIESMERLLAMRDKMKAEWAREQFFAALSGFQRECPVVEKTHKVHDRDKQTKEIKGLRYAYAAIEDLTTQAGPSMEKWGFSWTCKPVQRDGHVGAEVHFHHKDGHEEVTIFEVPIDPNAYMSDPQKAAAALTFSARYAFKFATGIQTKGEDNDAQDDDEPRRPPVREPRERQDAAVPVHHEEAQPEVKHNTDFDKAIWSLKATATDPKTKAIVKLFSENEVIDYTAQANQAKNKPVEMAIILKDIVETAKKRTRAVKGVEA